MITTAPRKTNLAADMADEQTQTQQASCWDELDGIIVINMDSHPERWEAFQRGVGASLPAEKLHRLSAVVGVEIPGYGQAPWFTERTANRARFWGGTAGCALSHRRAIEMARAKGWRKVLILEDDAVMAPLSPEKELALSHSFGLFSGMLYLGFNKPRPYGKPTKIGTEEARLWQIEGALATHAYAVHEGAYDFFLELLPTEENVWEWLARYRAIDTFYKDWFGAVYGLCIYAVIPQVFRQADVASCISGQTTGGVDYSCEGDPLRLDSADGLLHRLGAPFRRLKIRLNSLRTLLRARRGGLPGKRVRR